MLSHRYELHDIRDVEAFCERAIQRSGITEFGCLDREDLLAECVAFCWEIQPEFNPDVAKFSTFAGDRLWRFIVNWKRSDYRTRWVFKDRIYERPRPELVSYEAELGASTGSDHDSEAGQLARAISREFVDVADDRSLDLVRALRTGGSAATRQADPLGEASTREAA